MSAYDLTERLREWTENAINDAAMGEEFGYNVQASAVRTPHGTDLQFLVCLTMRTPLLGRPPFTASFPVPVAFIVNAQQEAVRIAIHKGMGGLRELHRQSLQALKHGPNAVPANPPNPQ